MEALECGAACLGIILGYYGRIVPLEQLRVDCAVSRDGSNAGNVLKAARTYGLETHGYRYELDQLKDVPLPYVVFWEFDHFLVVEGYRKDGVYLNDPAMGPRVASFDEFDEGYTGVTLTFKPTEEFQKGGLPFNLLQALLERLQGGRAALLYALAVSLLLVLPGLALPALLQVFVDKVLLGNHVSWSPWLSLGLCLTVLFQGGLSALQQRHLVRLQTALALRSSGQFMGHTLRLPLEFFNQRLAGELASRVELNDQVADLVSGQMATAFFNLVVVMLYLAVMMFYSPPLALIALVMALGNVLLLRQVARARKDANSRLLQEAGKLQGTTMHSLQIIETLKATGAESDAFQRWAGYQANVVRVRQEIGRYNQWLSVLSPLLINLSAVLILIVGAWQVLEGQLSLGALVAFQGLVAAFLLPIGQLSALGSRLQEIQSDLNRLDDVLHYPVEAPVPEPSSEFSGALELRDVTFGYNKLGPPLIEGLSLKLAPGHRVAIVGATGSGKSTIARLVNGLYAPWSGDILFDGRPERPASSSFGQVNQEITIFSGTVRENLTLWDPTVPEEEMIQAAEDALIHEDVMALPGGYDAEVGEGGRNFSGGQRQRLEIARALVRRPTLLVLDEATSALDPVIEKAIDDNLRRRGCACLIVAHRLSTIRDADEIVVLQGGKAAERGKHAELLAKNGVYAELCAAELGL